MTHFVDGGGVIDWGRTPYGQSGNGPTGTFELLASHYCVNESRQFIQWETYGASGSGPTPTSTYELLKKHHYAAHEHQIIQWESWGTSETVIPPEPPTPDERPGPFDYLRPRPKGQGVVIHAPLFETALIGFAPEVRAFDDTENQNVLAILLMAT